MDVTAAATLFAWLDPEIWLVTAQADGKRNGFVATLVSQASSVPDLPRMLVSVARHHRTWELVEASRSFALHLLGEDNVDLIWQFGLDSGHHQDHFAALEVRHSAAGTPVLEKTIGWLDCRVETSLDIGDRTLYVAEVVEGRVVNFAPPLTNRRLLELAPSTRLTQMQRSRHHDSYSETEAIRAWRERHGI